MNKQYLKNLKKLNVLLTKNEAEFLLNITKSISNQGVILEIGSYKGGSAFLLAKGSIKNKKGKVYTIDPNIHNLKSLKENIKSVKMEDWIIPITKTSEQVAKNWKKLISLLFIDGNHNYPFVKMDFLLWEKYLLNGGIIALHDSRDFKGNMFFINGNKRDPSHYQGPKRIIKENIFGSNRFKEIEFIESITYAKKIHNSSPIEILKNKLILCKIILIIKITDFYRKMDRTMGLIGLFLKKYSPKLYFKLKILK